MIANETTIHQRPSDVDVSKIGHRTHITLPAIKMAPKLQKVKKKKQRSD